MSNANTLLLTPGQTSSYKTQQASLAIHAFNTSFLDVMFSGYGVDGSNWIPSGTSKWLYAKVLNTGRLDCTAFNNENISPPPVGNLLIAEYVAGESLPNDFPVTIPPSNVNVSGNVIIANQLSNQGNAANTTIESSRVGGDTVDSFDLTNDGKLTLGNQGASNPHSASLTVGSGVNQPNQSFNVDGSGNVKIPNGASFQSLSNALIGPTLYNLLGIDSNNNGFLDLPGGTIVNGTIAGSLTFAFPFWGPALKVCVVTMGGFNSAALTITLPSALPRCWFFVGGLGGGASSVQPKLGAASIPAATVTALGGAAAGTIGSNANIKQASMGEIETTIDSFVVTVGGVSNGSIIFIGLG